MVDLIYNQKKIPKDQWRYGFRSSAATGCGWIATYNALQLMGSISKSSFALTNGSSRWFTAMQAHPSGGLPCGFTNGASR